MDLYERALGLENGSGNSLEAATAHHRGTESRRSPLSKRRSLRITSSEFKMELFAY